MTTSEEEIMTGYDYVGWNNELVKEIEPFTFNATLTYIGMGRGRSSVVYHFRHPCGMVLTCGSKSMGDIMKCLQGEGSVSLDQYGFTGEWEFKKNGKSVYIYPVLGFDNK